MWLLVRRVEQRWWLLVRLVLLVLVLLLLLLRLLHLQILRCSARALRNVRDRRAEPRMAYVCQRPWTGRARWRM